ncbi:MAG TPA: hypothetical protein VGE11_11720 [Pseudonocardia sp.]
MSEREELPYKISMLGPTRVGKTSIVASMLHGGEQMLIGSSVTMSAGDPRTERLIALTVQGLQGALKAGAFQPESLRQTNEPQHFTLLLDSGVPGAAVRFDLLDFPGGWLNPITRPEGREQDWQECLRFIKESSVLIVPVDAGVLMEAALQEYKRAWPAILRIADVVKVAGDWAAGRKVAGEDEPALLVYCPVKCESYFDDNGGRIDRSEELFRRFHDEYGEVIDRVRREYGGVDQLYCPVDTIGCVELRSAEWIPAGVDEGSWRFAPTFQLRPEALNGNATLAPKGVDDVLAALCRHLMEARQAAEKLSAEGADSAHDQARELADRSEGIFRDLVLWLTRERARRHQAEWEAGARAKEVRGRVDALDKVVRDIADRPLGHRARGL